MSRKIFLTYLSCIFIIFFVFNYAIHAQPKKLLNLNDAIDIALEKSYQVKSLRLAMVQAKENLDAAKENSKQMQICGLMCQAGVNRLLKFQLKIFCRYLIQQVTFFTKVFLT